MYRFCAQSANSFSETSVLCCVFCEQKNVLFPLVWTTQYLTFQQISTLILQYDRCLVSCQPEFQVLQLDYLSTRHKQYSSTQSIWDHFLFQDQFQTVQSKSQTDLWSKNILQVYYQFNLLVFYFWLCVFTFRS